MTITVTDCRNPTFVFPDDLHTVDLEINTMEHGWLDTTIDMDDEDPSEHIVQIKQWIHDNAGQVDNYVAPVRTLQEVYDEIHTYIEVERNAALVDPEGVVTTPNGLVWQVDPLSLAQLNDTLTTFAVLNGTPEGFVWRDNDDTNHPASLTFLAEIAAERAVQVQEIWTLSWTLKAALKAAFEANDIETMEAITW